MYSNEDTVNVSSYIPTWPGIDVIFFFSSVSSRDEKALTPFCPQPHDWFFFDYTLEGQKVNVLAFETLVTVAENVLYYD